MTEQYILLTKLLCTNPNVPNLEHYNDIDLTRHPWHVGGRFNSEDELLLGMKDFKEKNEKEINPLTYIYKIEKIYR
jgi:hypothetical protein